MTKKQKINIEALKKVSTWLKRLKHTRHFNMYFWTAENECGTSFCIAGRALFNAGLLKLDTNLFATTYLHPVSGRKSNPFTAARKLLGLTMNQARGLFFCGCNTPKEASNHIDNFIKENG